MNYFDEKFVAVTFNLDILRWNILAAEASFINPITMPNH